MESSIFVLNEFMLLLSGIAIFSILFVIVHKILKQISFFRGPTAAVAAICVSLLSVMGLSRFFVITDIACETTKNHHYITLDFILLPYTALALAIILVLLLSFVNRIFKDHRMNKSSKEISTKKR